MGKDNGKCVEWQVHKMVANELKDYILLGSMIKWALRLLIFILIEWPSLPAWLSLVCPARGGLELLAQLCTATWQWKHYDPQFANKEAWSPQVTGLRPDESMFQLRFVPWGSTLFLIPFNSFLITVKMVLSILSIFLPDTRLKLHTQRDISTAS